MLIKYIFVSVIILCFFSCSLVQRRELPTEAGSLPQATLQDSLPKEPPHASFKKTISDHDLKKNHENTELKKRVVILPFIDIKGGRDASILKKSYEAFIDGLNQSEELIALDAEVLKLNFSKYQADNKSYDLKSVARDSQHSGVSSILEGRIVDIRFKDEDTTPIQNDSSLKTRSVVFDVVIQVRMLNIRSEQELFNTVKTVTIEDSSAKIPDNLSSESFFNRNSALTELLIKDAFLDFVPKLVEALKFVIWEGRIAALYGEKIYLNVGQISGVQVGDILKVVDDGNEVYDTELGYHIGKVAGRVKGTLEVVGFFGQDGAVSIIHSGAGFKENDRIELYQ